MANWKYRVNLKHLLTEDDSDENAIRVGKEVARIVRVSTWYKENTKIDPYSDLEETLEFLETVNDVEEFNYYLDWLYDLADAERAWIA